LPDAVRDCSGSFAEVYKARCKADGTEWAIKAIKKALLSQQDRDALGIEVEILEKVSHPNVVSLRQVRQAPVARLQCSWTTPPLAAGV
jgi:serine/threonine protein kinase